MNNMAKKLVGVRIEEKVVSMFHILIQSKNLSSSAGVEEAMKEYIDKHSHELDNVISKWNEDKKKLNKHEKQ